MSQRRGSVLKVLVIEDDRHIVDAIRLAFKFRWPEATLVDAGTGLDGIEKLKATRPDIIILDLNLPDITGFEVLNRIREFSKIPVIILSVRADEEDMLRGLETGADDYITKPFNYMNLLARVKSVLRRVENPDLLPDTDATISDRLRIDRISQQVWLDDHPVKLTPYEYKLLTLLVKESGKIVPYQRIMEVVWGQDQRGNSDQVRIYVSRLRKKLGDEPPRMIINQRRSGYMFQS